MNRIATRLWSLDGMLVDENEDGVIDSVSLFIDLPEGLCPEGLIDFCARTGFETTAISFSLFEKMEQKVTMSFVHAEKTTATFVGNQLMLFYENEDELSALLRELAFGELARKKKCQTAFYSDIESLSDIWSFSGFGKQVEASPTRTLSLQIAVAEDVMSTPLLKELCHFSARAALYSTEIEHPVTGHDGAQVVFTIAAGEGVFLELIDKNRIRLAGKKTDIPHALQTLAKSNHWSEGGVFGYWEQEQHAESKRESSLLIEKSWSDEGEVERAIRVLRASPNLTDADVEIYLSEPRKIRVDLAERLAAEFPELKSIRIRSSFKTGFHWMQEEVLPNLANDICQIVIEVQREERIGALELPIRWIQEIYPIDSYIEETTPIPANAVTFLLNEAQSATYEVYGTSERNGQVLLGILDVPVSKMDYVDGEHVVYPSTSAVRIIRDGSIFEEKIIDTDRATFYRYYVDEILPQLRKSVASYNEGQGHTRPLFDRIEIDVWMSEEELKIPVDEERISSLEALHEDLYFNTLDYFAQMGIEMEGQPFNAPGGIHPYMHIAEDKKPRAKVRIYQWDDEPTTEITTTHMTFTSKGGFDWATINVNDQAFSVEMNRFYPPEKHIHEDVDTWLKQQSHYKVVYPDHSYNGHAIPVIECYEPTGEEFESMLKMTLMKKTVFIEAGHHANEVSSTPAIFKLLYELNLKFPDLYKKMNIVIIPLANPDGYELLKDLMIEHPKWKHHAARYNAVGLEFAHIRFQETIFGEANVYPEILRKWAPDIIIDNHGIPAHEWIQPFAGYNSPPRFPVSYFLPSAKIYGIGRISHDVNQSVQQDNLKAIVSNVSHFIKNTGIAAENDYWQQRFIKYGNQWLPDIFPIEEAEGIHFYTGTTVTPTYKSVGIMRYPNWVAADIISEAADEIVSGDALMGCIDAQKIFNLAIIDSLLQAETEVEKGDYKMSRERPIQL